MVGSCNNEDTIAVTYMSTNSILSMLLLQYTQLQKVVYFIFLHKHNHCVLTGENNTFLAMLLFPKLLTTKSGPDTVMRRRYIFSKRINFVNTCNTVYINI